MLIRQRKVRIEIEQTGSGPTLIRRERVQIQEQQPAWPRLHFGWLVPNRLVGLLTQRLRRKPASITLPEALTSTFLDLPAPNGTAAPKGEPRS